MQKSICCVAASDMPRGRESRLGATIKSKLEESIKRMLLVEYSLNWVDWFGEPVREIMCEWTFLHRESPPTIIAPHFPSEFKRVLWSPQAIAFLSQPWTHPIERSRPITISPIRCCCVWAFLNQPELRSSGCEQQVTPLIELYTSSNPNWTPNPNCSLTPFWLNWCTAHLQLTSTLIDWTLTRWNSFQNVFSLSSRISSKAKTYRSSKACLAF